MLTYVVDQSSVDQTVDYLEAVRKRIFEQVRLGMGEAMDRLGEVTAAEMHAAGIQSHTGQLQEAYEFHSVQENRNAIVGLTSSRSPMKIAGRTFDGFVGTALDEGYHVPAIEDKLLQFAPADDETLYRRGHVAFDVRPHPFLRQAVAAWQPTLMDIIQERVAAATGGA